MGCRYYLRGGTLLLLFPCVGKQGNEKASGRKYHNLTGHHHFIGEQTTTFTAAPAGISPIKM
jgi:hypothetical protein